MAASKLLQGHFRCGSAGWADTAAALGQDCSSALPGREVDGHKGVKEAGCGDKDSDKTAAAGSGGAVGGAGLAGGGEIGVH